MKALKNHIISYLNSFKNKGISIEYEKYEMQLKMGYTIYRELSNRGMINQIIFENNESIITLNDNRRYYFNPNDNVAKMYSIPHTGIFELKETKFVSDFIKSGQTCIDVGANFGWYTILFSKLVGQMGEVHAFEPLPHTYKVLKKNIHLNGCKNVVINNEALDEKEGQRDLFLPDIGVSGSFQLHNYQKKYDVFKCLSTTIDAYCSRQNINEVDFIKADIEGAEWLMLKGAINTLKTNIPTLFLEIQRSSTILFGYEPKELFEWLMNLGYIPYFVTDEGFLLQIQDYRQELPDYNFFFIHEDSGDYQ